MDFDPNSATLAFDPSSAAPVAQSNQFDPASARPVESSTTVALSASPSRSLLGMIQSGIATVGEAMRKNALPQEGVPAVTVPRFGEPGTVERGISEGISGLIEGATTPEGIAAVGLLPVPVVGPAVGTAMLAAGSKATAQLAGEASVTKNPQTIAEAATMGAATLLGARGEFKAAKELHGIETTPLTVAALENAFKPETAKPVEEAPNLPTVEVSFPESKIESAKEAVTEPLITKPASEGGAASDATTFENMPAGLVEPAGTIDSISQAHAENWIRSQQKLASQTPLGKASPDASLKVVSEWIRKGETPEGPIPPSTQEALVRSLGSTIDRETGETLDLSNPEWPRTGTLIDFLEKRAQSRISEGPGAASPGDVPKDTQIKQLTEAIKPTEPVKENLGFQIKSELKRSYDEIVSKAETSIQNLKSLGSQVLASLKGEQPWTDFKDALGKFSGQNNRNSYELQQFTKEIKRTVPSRLRREAIVNWIQADGDPALLRERANNSTGPHQTGYETALSLTPDEMTLASNVRSYLDSKLQEGIDAGLLKQGIENYVTQLWDRPNPIVNKLIGEAVSGKLSTNFKFARQRIFDSYFEGEQAGFKPKLKDIGGLVASYDQSFSRAIAGRKLIKSLHEGKASDGRPLVEISGVSNLLTEGGDPKALLIKPKAKPEDLSGYKPIDHPALRGWKWAGTDPATGASILYQGDMVVHPEVYTHLKNVLGSSALRQNAFFRGLLNVQAVLKQSKLALSGFHFTQEGTHAAAHRVNPFAPGKVDFSIPDQSALVDHGLEVADYRAYQAFSEGVSGVGSIYERVPVVGKWLTRYNEYLFQEYIPRLKMTMAIDALGRNRERFSGKLTDDQILELTANQSNAAFGALNYDMLGRNKTLQDFIRLGALAPDFLEARFRFAAQAMTKTGAEQRTALALQAATLYVGTRLLNQALTGDAQWDPKNAFEVLYNKRKYGIRSVVEDSMHFATDPARFISNRLAPVSKAAVEFATGRDWKGVKRTSLEQLQDVASWLVPITADQQSDRSKTDTALAASGVTVRSATAQQRLYEQLKSFKEANGLISKDEKAGMVSPSEYADLRNALNVGNDAAAKRAYEALLHPTDGTKAKTAVQIREHFIDSVRAPFSGSHRVEMQFLKSLDKKGNELYLQARQERKDLAIKFIAKQREWSAK